MVWGPVDLVVSRLVCGNAARNKGVSLKKQDSQLTGGS